MNKALRREILVKARHYIETDADGFLCSALLHVSTSAMYALDFRAIDHEVHAMRREINESLLPYHDLVSWLFGQLGMHGIRYASDVCAPYCGLLDYHGAKHLRLAWIDRMLEDLE